MLNECTEYFVMKLTMTTTALPHLEKYISLSQAAKRPGITAASLQNLIDNSNVKAVQFNGTVAVAESELDQAIAREQLKHLREPAITIPQAAEI